MLSLPSWNRVNGTLLNFGKRYEDDWMVIFDQWPKLHLGLDALSNQKILKGVYYACIRVHILNRTQHAFCVSCLENVWINVRLEISLDVYCFEMWSSLNYLSRGTKCFFNRFTHTPWFSINCTYLVVNFGVKEFLIKHSYFL